MSYDVTIVIPTFNECPNIANIANAIAAVMKGRRWEIVFVDDDSQDGTREEIMALINRMDCVRRIRRVGRRGLSSACIEGILSSSAPKIVVMDADGQHDETIIPKMLDELDSRDLVVATRYAKGGSTGELARHRVWISQLASELCHRITRVNLSDPMSGFFAVRRMIVEDNAHKLSGMGYKILLDILSSVPSALSVSEIPYRMRVRHSGSSKLDALVVVEYLKLLLEKKIGHLVPLQFLMFTAVGALGVMVHLTVLYLSFRVFTFEFTQAQLMATFVAMIHNFVLNNLFTYRDQRLVGWRFWGGLVSFVFACSLGALINVTVALYGKEAGVTWWLAGGMGAFVGAIWNYAITSTITWKRKPA